jgi:uncharacterized membrane protein
MFASVEAILLSTFVLITQNKMARKADRRSELDLQISLLSEHEVTRLIHLVSAVAERLGIETAADQELGELKQDVRPEQVLDKIAHVTEQFAHKRVVGVVQSRSSSIGRPQFSHRP